MQFRAPKNAGLILHVRDPEVEYLKDGRERRIRNALVADFAEQAITETYQGFDITSGDAVTGETFTAPRGGGWFDSDVWQRTHGATDEEREAVEQKLLSLCPNNPNPGAYDADGDGYGRVELYVPKPMDPPWPKIDEQKPAVVVRVAEDTGQVDVALAYEKSKPVDAQRLDVIDGLSKLSEQVRAEEELTAA